LRLCDKRVNSRLHWKESILVLGKNLGSTPTKESRIPRQLLNSLLKKWELHFQEAVF
jgi:hypothetical protein